MNPLIELKTTPLLLIAFVLACLALSPRAQALLPPPAPDGGYPGGNTAEGTNALLHVNTAIGINNTAVGFNALTADTSGQYNVAVGSSALASNTTGDFNMAVGTEALANSNGTFNLAIGFRTLFLNTTGSRLHRDWRCSAQEQHDRFGQYRHWFHCDEGEHYRQF